MIIRKATLKDISQLVTLVNSAYRGNDSKKGWTTEADLLDGIRTDANSLEQMVNKKEAVILQSFNENNVLQGCVYLEKIKDKMYLGMLTVSPLEQAKGLGKQLLIEAEKYAADQKCSIMEMTVISVRTELIAWYQKHGYRNTGKTKPFPNDAKFGMPRQPLEFIVMQKEI
ncbi:GNAT family N-acetyltransferase [Ginsengibacter hankyongi]|uniref:GNAT family N-acetyltransferase n=1 Tax=Ginsengibacter hankyongi TaxID=2607284 RepID=A0A5J5IJR8_9BACT|nr:GNAT family N-acetyltransferase [Ginsengibacter hankyongi]KAA9040643.1 GNAT family N-acetyltransferase [Ginsengibacter hankyongi]